MKRMDWLCNYTLRLRQSHQLVAQVQQRLRSPVQRPRQPRQQRRLLGNVLEKLLCGAKKGGNSTLLDVYVYVYLITTKGLVFMDIPDYDPDSATGQIAGKGNIVCFTTGCGSYFGSVLVPTVTLVSNTPMDIA